MTAFWPLWLLVYLLSFIPQFTDASALYESHRVCAKRSDGSYCSSGLLTGYSGPIDTAAQVKEAFAATAHRNELILFAESRLGEASQTLARFRNAGYSHIIAVLQEPEICLRLGHIFQPWLKVHGPISCGLYARQDASGRRYPVGFQYMIRGIGLTPWWLKWFTAARAVALGYNTMAVDSDSLVLDDFYFRVKAPSPLAKYNMFTQSEAAGLVNSGFVYIQNAASNGPIAWMLYDMVQKIVRWSEDPSELFKIAPKAGELNNLWGDDQESMSDVLFSAMAGKPRFFIIGYNIRGDEAAWQKLGVKTFQEHTARISGKELWTTETYNVSGEVAAVVCEHLPDIEKCRREPATSFSVMTAVLKMPHSGGEWPLELGGYPFNRTLGANTLAYRQSFVDLGVPLPPDPEDPATEAAARATKTELFAMMHCTLNTHLRFHNPNPMGWVQVTWYETGRQGLWHLHMLPHGNPYMGAGHVHAGLFPGSLPPKTVVLQTSGHWDWRIAARVAGAPGKVYFTTNGHQIDPDMPRVVAYKTGVIPASFTKEQFIAAVQGLAQVAVAIGAVAAWPDVDCNTAWVQMPAYRNQTRTVQTIPWVHLDTRFMVFPYGDSVEDLRCQWNGFTWIECLANLRLDGIDMGRGLLPVEFAHLLQRTRHELHAALGKDVEIHIGTTLKLAKDGPAAAPVPPGGSSSSSASFHDVAYADLLAANTDTLLHTHTAEHVPVLWLDRVVGNVTDMSAEVTKVYSHWYSKCRALKYWSLEPGQRWDW